jgi:hypothetical protein
MLWTGANFSQSESNQSFRSAVKKVKNNVKIAIVQFPLREKKGRIYLFDCGKNNTFLLKIKEKGSIIIDYIKSPGLFHQVLFP